MADAIKIRYATEHAIVFSATDAEGFTATVVMEYADAQMLLETIEFKRVDANLPLIQVGEKA